MDEKKNFVNKNPSTEVCGRISLFGEHTDWITDSISKKFSRKDIISSGLTFLSNNMKIKGFVTLQPSLPDLDKGYITVVKRKGHLSPEYKLLLKVPVSSYTSESDELDDDTENTFFETLQNIVDDENNYTRFIAASILVFHKFYGCSKGCMIVLQDTINKIPEKKGFASSAAICVLMIKLLFYAKFLTNDNLISEEEIAKLAYIAEHKICKTGCGTLDQVCAYDKLGMYRIDFRGFNMTKYNYLGEERSLFTLGLSTIIVEFDHEKNTHDIISAFKSGIDDESSKVKTAILDMFISKTKIYTNQAIDAYKDCNIIDFTKAIQYYQTEYNNLMALDPERFEPCRDIEIERIMQDSEIMNKIHCIKGLGSHGGGSALIAIKNTTDYEKNKEAILKLLYEKYNVKNVYNLSLY